MDINLDERRVTNAAEAVDLSGLDDQNVTGAGFEFRSVDGPETATFPHELDFIVRMTMGPGTAPRECAEQEHGDIHVAVISPDKVVGAALKWQVLLTDTVHRARDPMEGGYAPGSRCGVLQRSIGFAIPVGRKGSTIFRPSPADAYAA
jgi:hypothetical protein